MTQNEVITVALLATFALLLVMVWVTDRRRKKRGEHTAMSGVVGTFDEVFHPEAARAMEIREVQQQLPDEAPIPGDPLRHSAKITSGGLDPFADAECESHRLRFRFHDKR